VTQQCTRCKQIKPLDEFSKDSRKANGRAGMCKDCHNASAKASKKHTHYKVDKEASKFYSIKSRYGLTMQQYQEMVKAQNGRCAICGKIPTKAYGLQVDHDHSSGKVRALLCHACNVTVGFINESPELAMQIAKYLNEHQANC
jgi:cytochrome c553